MSSDIKIKQVEAVFSKAIDASIDSIGPNELDKYFGEIKNEFGGNIENALRNSLSHSRVNLQNKFSVLVEKSGLKYHLESSNQETRNATNLENTESIETALLDLLAFEEKQLQSLIKQATEENILIKQKLSNCNCDIEKAVEVIFEEEKKLKSISNQLNLEK